MTATPVLDRRPSAPLRGAATFLPRLAPRAGMASRGAAGFGASTAFIALSPHLVCVLESPGSGAVTHQEVGGAGLTVHQAWNSAADALLRAAQAAGGIEFWVRPASRSLGPGAPRGLEVRGDASRWLAHPRLFSVLHVHFTGVLGPTRELTYLSRDCGELFVFDAPAAEVADYAGPRGVMRYSLGFPLLTTA